MRHASGSTSPRRACAATASSPARTRRGRAPAHERSRGATADGQGHREIAAIARRRNSSTRSTPALRAGLGAARGEVAVALEHEMRLRGARPAFSSIVAVGPPARSRTPSRATPRSSRARSSRSTSARCARLLLGLHAHGRGGRAGRARPRDPRARPRSPARRPRRCGGRCQRARADAAARGVIEDAATASTSATVWATASASRSTRRRGSRASAATPCSCPETS